MVRHPVGPRSGQSGEEWPIGVRQFWQNWPKSLEVAPGELRIGICPDFEAGSHYDGHELIAEAKHYYYLRDTDRQFDFR